MADNDTQFITVESEALTPVADQPDLVQGTQQSDLLNVLERIEQHTSHLPHLLSQLSEQPTTDYITGEQSAPDVVAITVSPQQLPAEPVVPSSEAPQQITTAESTTLSESTTSTEQPTINDTTVVQQQTVETQPVEPVSISSAEPAESSEETSASEEAQSESQAENAQRNFLDHLGETISTSINSVTSFGDDKQTDDRRRSFREAAELSVGGPIAEAVQEVRDTIGEFRSEEQTNNNTVQRHPITGQFVSVNSAQTEPAPSINTVSNTSQPETVEPITSVQPPSQTAQTETNNHTQTVEAQAQATPAPSLSQTAQQNDTQTQTVELIEESVTTDEQHHEELINTIEAQPSNSGNGESGQSQSLFGNDEEADRNRGRRGRFRRFASRAGNVGKTLLKGASRMAAPLAVLAAGGLKYEELKDNEDLSAGQKAVQIGSTATGALGGALGGAAAGAAIGSVVPVVGTVIGGALGAIAGGLGGEKIGEWFGETISGWMDDDDEKPEAIQAEAKTKEENEQPLEKQAKSETQKPIEHATNTSSRVTVVEMNTPLVRADQATESVLAKPVSSTTRASAMELQHKPEPPQLIQTQHTTSDAENAKAAQQKTLSLDEKKLAQEIAKAMGSQQQHPRNDRESAVEVPPGKIPTEFDDTMLTLMAHDRM